MTDKSDKAEAPNSEKQEPTSAPEINPTLLTAIQKQRIEAEFELEDDNNPQQLKPSKTPEPTMAPTSPARPETTEVPLPGKDLSVDDDDTAPLPDEKLSRQPAQKTDKQQEQKPSPKPGSSRNPFKFFWRHKKWTLPVLLLMIVGSLAGVPYTRYALASLVLKQPYVVTVTDAATKKPVSSATVTLDGHDVKTDKDGKVTVRDVKPGHRQVLVSKKYYEDARADVLVPIYGNNGASRLELKATGRQVPITVTNKLTAKPLENITVKSVGTEVKTDKDGKAIIVVPADKPTLEVTLDGGGYNQLVARLTVTDQEDKNNDFALVPDGRIYFLSGQSGKLDVVKTNLDGGDRQTVVYGTGKEEDRSTVLLASRDWKYLALYSKRDSNPAKLYLVDTSTDKMSVMDDSNSQFALVGWSGHDFAFTSTRNGAKDWEASRQAVKSFSADKKQLLTMDQNQAEGDQASNKFQQFANPYLIKDKLVYSVEWFSYSGSDLSDRNDSIRMLTVGSQTKKDLRTFPSVQFNAFQASVYEPGGVYFAAWSTVDNKYQFFEYENGQVKDADVDQDKFFTDVYPTFLASPDGTKTFWSEQRDGRPTFFVGDQDAKSEKQVAVVDDGAVFGWYGADYLLLSKKGSELYVLPVAGGAPVKIADYHKPQVSYRGYGGGYGGL